MEVLSLGSYPSFFGSPSAKKSLSKKNVQDALKARKGTKEVVILNHNLAVITETGNAGKKLIKYYACRETLPDPSAGRKGNVAPWYQISKDTLAKLKELEEEDPQTKGRLRVAEIILLYWTLDQHSYSTAYPVDQVAKQWIEESNAGGKYRLNYQKAESENEGPVFTCSLKDSTVSTMVDDGVRRIAKDVEV